MDKVIEWFQQRQGRVSYSMNYRNGPNSYDCSSAIYHALIYAGILPQGFRIGNTETEFVDLPKFGFQRIEADANGYIPTQRGDIFIWGEQGYTNGADGHTGIYLDNDNIIHCSYGYRGIHTDNHDDLARVNNTQYLTIFRYTGKPQNAPAPQPEVIDDVINIGSHFKIAKSMRVAEVNIHEDRRELKIDELCPRGFTWAENGVPADWAVKVDDDGYKIDGEINAGDLVKLQGAFVAQEVVQNDGTWFARVKRDGIDVWMELTPVTEISAGDAGTITDYRPAPAPAPVEELKPAEPVVENPVENHIADVSKMVEDDPKPEEKPENQGLTVQEEEKKDMSHNLENSGNAENSKKVEKKQLIQINARPLTEGELKMLEDLQKNTVENIANTEYEPRISEKAKTTVYFVADLGILTNMLIATICVILIPNYTKEILAISGAIATAFAGLKPIFKLGAKK